VLYVRAGLALALPALVDVVVPVALVTDGTARFDIGALRLLGLVPIALGCWLLLDSVFVRFAREGRGTLAPIDPPEMVVRGGAFRVVRNPMYVANVAIVVGEGVMLESWRVLAWAAVAAALFHAFVVVYEEPTLHRVFGGAYDAYRVEVGRWIPRRRPR
jgi:protein-S-isoprenylcysteine O-methyltransferase Ste14